jgi:hypothetical protein
MTAGHPVIILGETTDQIPPMGEKDDDDTEDNK